MFIKDLQFAFRNFTKNKSTAIINILGLATGIAASLILFMIARYDTNYDKWEPDNKNIYRLFTYAGPDEINAGVTTALPEAIRDKVSGVRTVTHYLDLGGDVTVSVPKVDGKLQVFPSTSGVVFTDADFFKIFPHTWLSGSPESSLRTPNRVVLSKSIASVFFPGKRLSEMIGKPVFFGDSIQVTVSGIVEDLNHQSDFDFKVFLSYPTIIHSAKLKDDFGWGQWGHVSDLSNCIVKLNKDVNRLQVEKQLKELDFANNRPDPGMPGDEPRLLPIRFNHFSTEIAGVISRSTIINLSLVGSLILILAIINYINLSISSATLRAKEIGVRKSLGGNSSQIRRLFLTETFLITLMSILVGILLVPILIKGMGSYAPRGFSYRNVLNLTGFVYLTLMTFLITLAAGFYPALILSRFVPGIVLKGNFSVKGLSVGRIRKGLILSQFVIAQALLIFVIIVSKQINYSLSKDLGYKNKEGIISFYVPDARRHGNSKKYSLLQVLDQVKGVERVSLSYALPTSSTQRISGASAIINGINQHFSVSSLSGDTNFVNLFRIPLIAGSNLRADTSAGIMPVLINETLAKQLGYANAINAINGVFDYDGDKVLIRGVLNDFNINSLKNNIPPTLYYYDVEKASTISILLSGTSKDWHNTIGRIEKIFSQVYPDNVFNYRFFDQSIERLYRRDIAISRSLQWATALVIFISCLGLLGLVSFTANQRTKEIGIRKVLGQVRQK